MFPNLFSIFLFTALLNQLIRKIIVEINKEYGLRSMIMVLSGIRVNLVKIFLRVYFIITIRQESYRLRKIFFIMV